MSNDIPVTRGSGNVFADLGFDNPEEERPLARRLREERLAAGIARGPADSAAGRVTPLDKAFDRIRAAVVLSGPRVNIQKGKSGQAKAYQVKQVLAAIRKLEGRDNG